MCLQYVRYKLADDAVSAFQVKLVQISDIRYKSTVCLLSTNKLS